MGRSLPTDGVCGIGGHPKAHDTRQDAAPTSGNSSSKTGRRMPDQAEELPDGAPSSKIPKMPLVKSSGEEIKAQRACGNAVCQQLIDLRVHQEQERAHAKAESSTRLSPIRRAAYTNDHTK